MRDKTKEAFFSLVRAGLFPVHGEGFKVNDSLFQDVEWEKIYKLAQEQSVLGLVLAGLEQYKNLNVNLDVNQKLLLQWIGEVQLIEQRNKAMNQFIAELVLAMRKTGIYTLLVKGQGIAQCYERPLWRACGDVDFFLSNDNYQKAKDYLVPLASSVETEGVYGKHLGMVVDGWNVELHGSLRCGLSNRVDKVLEDVLIDTFNNGNVRPWNDDGVQVFMLGVENDAFYVFNHFLGHFYKGGIGLRQVCDWCRLLYTYRDSLNYELLESRIKRAGLLSEWKAFGAFAVEYLGMPVEAMPLLEVRCKKEDGRCEIDANLRKKADKICEFILEVGNFGHNRDMSFYHNGSYFVQKVKSFGRRCGDMISHFGIFPVGTIRFIPCIVFNGLRSAVRGE